MKKLMIAMAIVCAAACTQAASSFTFGIFTDSAITTEDGSGLYNGDVTISCEALSYENVLEPCDGEIGHMEDIACSANENYVFTLTAETDTHKYYQTATAVWTKVQGFDVEVHFAGGNAWTPVPEPTSGLLMLLGMAGLCLRRKQRS